jgi:DNA-binding response OmpR family regulator
LASLCACDEQGTILSRRELLERVWGNAARRERMVDHFVRKLRVKIDLRAPYHDFLHTWTGLGYQLEPRPKALDAGSESPDRRVA